MMNKILSLIEAHPDAFKLIMVPIIGGIVSFITKPRTPEEYMRLPAWLAGFMKAWRGLLPDPQQFAEGMVQAITNKALSPDAKRASLNPPAIITEKKDEEK